MIIAAPALVGAHAVLTRLPPPHRISPEAALTLLDNNFVKSVTVIALTAKSYEALSNPRLRTLGVSPGVKASEGWEGFDRFFVFQVPRV